MKMVEGIQAILRFSVRNLRGCNVDINDGMDLIVTPLRWG
jgi:hypothetical protein